MSFKIVLNDETKRVAKIPESFVSMTETIKSAFKGKCPASFVTKYIDSDGDYITVASEEDFAAMIQAANGNIKVLVYEDPHSKSQELASLESVPHNDYNIIVTEERQHQAPVQEYCEEVKEVQETSCQEQVVLQHKPHEPREEPIEGLINSHSPSSIKEGVKQQLKDVKSTLEQLKKQQKLLKGNKEAINQLKELIKGLKAQKRSLKHELCFAEGTEHKGKSNLEEISDDWIREKLKGILEDLLPTITARLKSEIKALRKERKQKSKESVPLFESNPKDLPNFFNLFNLPKFESGWENSIGNLFNHFAQEISSFLNPTGQCKQEEGPIVVEFEQLGVNPGEIRPNREIITVDVLLKNSGSRTWPKDLMLHNIAGLNSNDKIQVPELTPGASHKVTMSFENPQKIGEYASVCRLGYVKGEGFEFIGPEITLTFEVVEEKKEELRPSFPIEVEDRAVRFASIFPHFDLPKILPIVSANMSKPDDEIAELLLDLS